MNVELIAKVCHEANRAYCESILDFSQVAWEDAQAWQKQSAISGVKFKLANPGATPAGMHHNWAKEKLEAGWVYGPVKDAEKKTHPCLVAYGELPEEQRRKDALFSAIVEALK